MPIYEVYSIKGMGVGVCGIIKSGVVKAGDEVEAVGIMDTESTVVTGVYAYRQKVDEGRVGEDVQVFLRGTKRYDVTKGQVLCTPGSCTAYRNFDSQVDVLSSDEGGRDIENGDKLQFNFGTIDITGSCDLPDVEMLAPGESGTVSVSLDDSVVMEEGTSFDVNFDSTKIGSGVVSGL